MRRSLWIGLAVVGLLSLYVMSEPDDALLASDRQGKPGAGGASNRRDVAAAPSSQGGAGRARPAPGKAVVIEPWVSQSLTRNVAAWQARAASGPDLAGGRPTAWAGLRPPAPAVSNARPSAPPPPMAPPFPHAWVGRFNDEPTSPSAKAVSRAVLVGSQATWVVRTGDVIEGQWRVDLIQDRSMRLTYLPLQQQQTVAMK